MNIWKIAFPYLLFILMTIGVIWSNCDVGAEDTSTSSQKTLHEAKFDPVCNMQVNPAWGHQHVFEGTRYHFCCENCLRSFTQKPSAYVGERCPVCDKLVNRDDALVATYLNKSYFLCSEQHRQEFKSDPAGFFMHTMWGIPDWLYYLSISFVLLVSFVLFDLLRRRSSKQTAPQKPARWDLLQIPLIRRLVRSRSFRFSQQLLLVLLFGLIIISGLFGNQNPALNIAPILTWTIWWGGLVVLIMFGGKIWCYACPWDALAHWFERLSFYKKQNQGLGLGLRWPKALRNIGLATVLFVGLTWVELGFTVTMSPLATAWLGIALFVLAFVSMFLFDRRSFCRYGCLVGRVSGLYAMFSGVEVRSSDKLTCRSCRTKECSKGSSATYGCPTFEYPGEMASNTYCIQCMECVQGCPHNNLQLNLRPWGADLATIEKPRNDEAYLALLMLSITAFHGLTMTPVWRQLTNQMEAGLSIGRIMSFSLGMLLIMLVPVVLYALLVWISFQLSRGRHSQSDENSNTQIKYGDYFIRYAYCLLPIALFYHLAHNLEHLLMEGPKVFSLLSDPAGRGWDLLGTSQLRFPPLVSLDALWLIQVGLVTIGHVYSLWSAQQISHRLFRDEKRVFWGQWPVLIGMVVFSIVSLWLLKQPMEMRTSAM